MPPLRMTKGRLAFPWRAIAEQKPFLLSPQKCRAVRAAGRRKAPLARMDSEGTLSPMFTMYRQRLDQRVLAITSQADNQVGTARLSYETRNSGSSER
jgi:hypothetical protein